MNTGPLMGSPAEALPVVDRGEGAWLRDTDGRWYLDGCSGAVVASLGHGNAWLADVLAQQAARVAYVHRSQLRNEPAEQLAAQLSGLAPNGLGRALFVSSGSEANEFAMRLAVRYWQERGQPLKTGIVSRWSSYHGATLGALSATGDLARRKNFSELLHPYPGVTAPYCLRCPLGLRPADCAVACLDDLERTIVRRGPDRLAAFVAEPIVGAAAGVLVPPDGYYERVRELCDRYEVLWIADEIMTGCGRTGRWTASEYWDARPDLMTLGKGLGAGYVPISAVMCTDEVATTVLDSAAGLAVGHTFMNAPLAAAVGSAVVSFITEHDLVSRAERLGRQLHGQLVEMAAGESIVGDVRGLGLLQGIEFVADPETLVPFDPALRVSSRVMRAAREHGLLVYPAAHGIDGDRGDAVLIAPPLVLDDADVGQIVDRLRDALRSLNL